METIRIRKLSHANLGIECEDDLSAELREFFSFFVPGYKFMPAFRKRLWDGKIRLFDSRTGQLPAGLYSHVYNFAKNRGYDLHLLESDYGLPGDMFDVDPEELYHWIKTLRMPHKIRDYQFDALMHAIKNKTGILVSPTGSGKSLIIYCLVRYYHEVLSYYNHVYKGDKKVLIIVPTTSLVEQMFEDFRSYGPDLGIESYCHKIYSGKDKNSDCGCFISTWQSIYKLPFDWFEQFGMVIGDECHGFKAKSLTSIMNKSTEAEYRYGTTGTLDGTQTHELVLQGLFGKVFKVTTTKKLQESDTLAELNINRIELEYSDKVKKEFGKKEYQEEIEFIVSNEKRNKFIKNLALDLKGNTLVLYNYVEKHGKPIFELIDDNSAGRKVFFVSGQTDTNDREAIRKIIEKQKNAIVVASLGTFSTGINIRNLHNIIFASPSKSQIRVLQSIGRGLRKSDNNEPTKLYDIIDNISWKSRKNFAYVHAEERLKIYNKEKFNHKTYKVDI